VEMAPPKGKKRALKKEITEPLSKVALPPPNVEPTAKKG